MAFTSMWFIVCLILIQACNHSHQITMKSLEDPRLPPEGAMPVTEAESFTPDQGSLLNGKAHFEKDCIICHGVDGSGHGYVTTRGLKKPDSLYEGEMLNAQPEYFFEIMSHGKGRMPSMARRLSVRERWEVAHYIKALQLSRRMNLKDLNAEDKSRFK